LFQGWENFYFLIGSAGAGLVGLLFVVVTLTPGGDRARVQRGQRMYMTPIALAFALVLSISAVALTPGLLRWESGVLVAALAAAGLVNGVKVSVALAQPRPELLEPPHWSDFWMYGVSPAAIYGGLILAALGAGAGVVGAVDALAALLLALLLVGLRDAWDLITWIAPLRATANGQTPNGQTPSGQ
jgi:hypothetical protein